MGVLGWELVVVVEVADGVADAEGEPEGLVCVGCGCGGGGRVKSNGGDLGALGEGDEDVEEGGGVEEVGKGKGFVGQFV